MDGKLFLGTARFLQSKGDEAAYRSAVSRAYYACFLAACRIFFDNCDGAMLRKASIKNARGFGHDRMVQYLKCNSQDVILQLAEDLAGLRANRTHADYDMAKPLTARESQKAIEEAESLLNDFTDVGPVRMAKALEKGIQTLCA